MLVLGNFDWTMEGYLFELFCCIIVNSCNVVVFFLDYLLQIKVGYFVNLAACGLATSSVLDWSIFQNVHSSPRMVLEKVLERS